MRIHAAVRERLARLGVSISRREVMYLFDAFCAVLRAASEAKEDKEWMSQVAKNAGIIVSIDGIKPDGGNETIYLVRDALPRSPVECRKRQRKFGGETQTGSLACCSPRHSSAGNHQ